MSIELVISMALKLNLLCTLTLADSFPSNKWPLSSFVGEKSFELGPRPFSGGRGTRKKISRIGIRKSWQA